MTACRHAVSSQVATLPPHDPHNSGPAQITTKLLEQLRTNTPQSPPQQRAPGPEDQSCEPIPRTAATSVPLALSAGELADCVHSSR